MKHVHHHSTNTMSIFSFLFSTFFLCYAIPCYSNEPINPEVEALMSIKRALKDNHGVLSSWDEDSVDPCSWTMIICSPDNLVTSLGAPSQFLSGTLSAAIGNLTNLRQLLLQNNNLSGLIPQEIGTLSELGTLDLSNNKFTGVVPESLGQLNNLQYLRLNNNSLSGAIPVSLAKVSQLAFLDLSYNNLSGPVPKFPAKTFNVAGNPLICGSSLTEACSGSSDPDVLSLFLSSSSGKSKKLGIALGISLSIVFIILLALGFAWHTKKRRKHSISNVTDNNEKELFRLGNLRPFTFRELQSATGNFSTKNLLGAGGFGVVYRGKLGDGTMIAVKRLKDAIGTAGESQFQMELEMISLAVHRNLLRLIGYCVTSTERLLVYPFMSNGSVASRLRAKPALDWNRRKRIANGIARGLVYLHEQCDPKIIHRDVKAANVLLDDYYEAVVGDFGLAKLLDHADSYVTTAVRGTVGHIAPEYLSTGQSSEKTDVFGFGILLIELISGMKSREYSEPANHKGAMLDWVKKLHQEKKVEMLVDRELKNNYDRIEVGKMLQVALLCTHYLPSHRPKMSEVVQMLEGDGPAEKWAPSHNHIGAAKTLAPSNKTNHSSAYHAIKIEQSDICPDSSTMLRMAIDDEDDEYTLDSYAIELSGPR